MTTIIIFKRDYTFMISIVSIMNYDINTNDPGP